MGELALGPRMIEVTTSPSNEEHFGRLTAFAREVLAACEEAGVEPILDGGLAVFAYTQHLDLEVRDVDFGCPESEFPRLQVALQQRGIFCEIRSWHVLQARRDGLKVEFGAIEHWNRGIPNRYELMRIAGIEFRVMHFDGLREQYRRGAENTAENGIDSDPAKHQSCLQKLRLMDAIADRSRKYRSAREELRRKTGQPPT